MTAYEPEWAASEGFCNCRTSFAVRFGLRLRGGGLSKYLALTRTRMVFI